MAKTEVAIDSMRQDLLHYEWVLILKEKSAVRQPPSCCSKSTI